MAKSNEFIYRGPSGRFAINGKRFQRDGEPKELTDEEQESLKKSHPHHQFEAVSPAKTEDPNAVPKGSVDDVLVWVGDDLERAQRALDAEQVAGDKARKTLIAGLEERLAPPNNNGQPGGDQSE